MDKKNSGGMNIGTSSILVTFVLLCLVTFSALSYMSARSDYKLSRQTAERTVAYYDANRMAEIYMANIEDALRNHADTCDNAEDYISGVERVFADNEIIQVEKNDENVSLSYVVKINEAQNLQVVLSVHYPDVNDSAVFHIDRWSTDINNEYVNSLKNDTFEGDGLTLMF